MKKALIFTGTALLLVILGLIFFSLRKEKVENFEECAAAGYPIMESYPRQCRAGEETFVEDIPEEEANIRVAEPQANAEIGLPFTLSGEARTFESTVNFRIRDEDGSILHEDFTTALVSENGTFGEFSTEVSYPAPKGTTGMIEVFEYSAQDGSEINMVRIPIVFGNLETSSVRVYFTNTTEDPEVLHCEVTYPVERRIPKTEDPMHGTLRELLKGPTVMEQSMGFSSSINPGVKLLGLTVEEGTVTADFDAMMQFQLGGSCRVMAIRSQIENTLKQFPEVEEVVIAVDGETEGVLEP